MRPETGPEPVDDVVRVRRTAKHCDGAASDWDDRVSRPVTAVTTARTSDTASRTVLQKRRGVLGGQSAHPAELLSVVATADQRNRKLIEQQERGRLSAR